MSTEKKPDGGPAYPSLKTTWNKSPGVFASEIEPGMTLRDHFAGLAMAALIIAIPHGDNAVGYAQEAYEMADAMLKAREQ